MREVTANWPVQGKPRRLGVDNGSEFHSQAFERGCAQHGIAIEWRPPGRPHFGGVIERVIGTLMGLVHELPGTTFSNVGQRESYDSDRAACLTLDEVEHWLAVAVAKSLSPAPARGSGRTDSAAALAGRRHHAPGRERSRPGAAGVIFQSRLQRWPLKCNGLPCHSPLQSWPKWTAKTCNLPKSTAVVWCGGVRGVWWGVCVVV